MRRRAGLLWGLLLLAVPWPTRVVPAWEVQALGPDAEPIPYLLARQRWRDATAMDDPLERTLQTGADGRVGFPSRWAWASTAARAYRLATLGDHCSVLYANVYVWDEGYTTGAATYLVGEPLPRSVHVQEEATTTPPVRGREARLRRFGRESAGRASHC